MQSSERYRVGESSCDNMSDEESEKAPAPVWASQRAKLNSRSNHVKLQGSGDTFHSFDPKEKVRT